MEKRINKKLEAYTTTFKEDVKSKITQLGMTNDIEASQLLQFIYDYERFSLTKEDFMKRKRVKNTVNLSERCCAKRANGEQCTRRKKEQDEYCGTHMKGTPHGIFESQEEQINTSYKIEVWAQDIQGIMYYIDKSNNVYQPEDIIANKINPKIIAKYVKNGEHYSIPIFGI
jgi:hypothetical protein